MQIREYARITTDQSENSFLDCGVVSEATFEWLQKITSSWKGSTPIALINDHRSLTLGSYVGYLQSPAGEGIEIFPKTGFGVEQPETARRVLQRMLKATLGIKPRTADPADLMRMNQPIHEWVFGQFLEELQLLLKKGLRFDYQRIEEESRFLRGQLRVAQQQRQPPDRQHLFQINHDIFSADRLENRLLRTALSYILSACKCSENFRLANELSHLMATIPLAQNPSRNMEHWKSSKLMQSYDAVRPWCELILEKLNPNFQQGSHRGIALLFPMEQLFEKYVEATLRHQLPSGFHLKGQASSEYLLRHTPAGSDIENTMFQLKPDLLLEANTGRHVLDVKWKLLDQDAWQSDTKYRISQADLYQLFAYAHKYQGGKGHMMLIYPKHQEFSQPLPAFYYSDDLIIWAVPFCIEQQKLIPGDWQKHISLTSDHISM